MAVVSAEGLQVPVADRDLDPPVVVELLDLIECGAAPFPWEQSQPVLDPRTADSGDFRVAVEESLEHFEGAHDFQIARRVVVSGEKQALVASCLGGGVDRDIGIEHASEANVRGIEQVADPQHETNVLRKLILEIGKSVSLTRTA